MSKTKRNGHRDDKPSKGRNLDLQAMFANAKGGPHANSRNKRASNKRRFSDEENDYDDCY